MKKKNFLLLGFFTLLLSIASTLCQSFFSLNDVIYASNNDGKLISLNETNSFKISINMKSPCLAIYTNWLLKDEAKYLKYLKYKISNGGGD